MSLAQFTAPPRSIQVETGNALSTQLDRHVVGGSALVPSIISFDHVGTATDRERQIVVQVAEHGLLKRFFGVELDGHSGPIVPCFIGCLIVCC